MIDFCLQDCLFFDKRACLFYTENGREIGARIAFSHGSLVGVHLSLPRALGVSAAYLHLRADGETGETTMPLCLRASRRGVDTYALLLDEEIAAGASLFFFRVTLECLFGCLHAHLASDGSLYFTRERGETFPLLFTAASRQNVADGLDLLSLSGTQTVDEGAHRGFFSHPASLGVEQINLSSPTGEGARGNGQDPSACLPRALADAPLSDNLRAALLACPDKNIEVNPGPEVEHMLRVYVINPEGLHSTWPICAVDNDYESEIQNADEIRQRFFPPFERLLNVTYAICSAVEQVN